MPIRARSRIGVRIRRPETGRRTRGEPADYLGGVLAFRAATYTAAAITAAAIVHTTQGCRAGAGSAGTTTPAMTPEMSRPTIAPPRICFLPAPLELL